MQLKLIHHLGSNNSSFLCISVALQHELIRSYMFPCFFAHVSMDLGLIRVMIPGLRVQEAEDKICGLILKKKNPCF